MLHPPPPTAGLMMPVVPAVVATDTLAHVAAELGCSALVGRAETVVRAF